MRYMLGHNYDEPSLLVEVEKVTDDGFHFWVVNGAWEGKFTYTDVDQGSVYVNRTKETVQNVLILSENQDRLRGAYQDVFYHWEDENYLAPIPKEAVLPEDWDDDIAF